MFSFLSIPMPALGSVVKPELVRVGTFWSELEVGTIQIRNTVFWICMKEELDLDPNEIIQIWIQQKALILGSKMNLPGINFQWSGVDW